MEKKNCNYVTQMKYLTSIFGKYNFDGHSKTTKIEFSKSNFYIKNQSTLLETEFIISICKIN